MPAFLCIASLLFAAQSLGSPESPLVHSAVIDAPVEDVWTAWTTTEGIKSWMVSSGEVDLRVGGHLRTSYQAGSDLTGPDAIENTILSYDPLHMLSIKTTKTPESFPFKEAMKSVWTVIYFESLGKQTRIISRMLGYTAAPDSQKMRQFFARGNQITLDELAKKFRK